MALDPNSYNREPGQGSLSGFTNVTLASGNPVLPKTGWSAEEIRRFLLNESDLNFPSAEFVNRIEQQIQDHINNFQNPHQINLDQIIANFVRDVLGNITPGTPPQNPPFFAYEALHALPFGTIFPATFSSTNMLRMNEGGVYIDPSTEIEIFGTDNSPLEPGLPLFSSVQDGLPSNWATQNLTPVNATATVITDPAISYPFSLTRVSETASSGSHGVTITVSETVGTAYTFVVMMRPSVSGSSVILSQPNNTADTMTVNLSTGVYTLSSAAVMGETFVYPNGFVRVAFSYTTDTYNSANAVQIIHLDPNNSNPSRTGQDGRALFVFSKPAVTKLPVNQPYQNNRSNPGTCSPLVLNLSKVQAPSVLQQLMIRLSFNMYPVLPNAVMTDTQVMTFGALTITRDQTKIYVKLSGTVLFTSVILPGLNVLALSYSPSSIIFKDLASARQQVSGTYPALSTTTVSVGPCAAYLTSLAIYASNDTAQCVEFLTNG